ncbi:TonB family protein [Sulfurimonas sp.]|uniref:energy transducer TonB family protein n=1 Tax=Sulfurimonas sp. TaxID=2022749 RepID=UPI002AB2ECDF|nr:TonB family protein [Sulfurimonas sp.]
MKIKLTIIFLLLTSILNASVIATQNMKALYKDVELTEVQEDYILDNQDNNIDIIQKILMIEIRKKNIKYLNEKNVVSFTLTPAGEITKIKFLKTSNDRKLDSITKKAIKKASKVFVKPKEPTQIRFIISYRVGESKRNNYNNQSRQDVSTNIKKPYYMTIERGTTKFNYQSEEYTRVFETTKDGFINMTQEPHGCIKRVTILKDNGEKIAEATGGIFNSINKEAEKGKYKILIQTKKDCKINLDYQ